MINQDFENTLETIALEFTENISTYKKILSLHHNDADGICSALLIEKLMLKLKVPYTQRGFNLEISWEKYIDSLMLADKEFDAIIFSDLCPAGDLLYHIASQFPDIHFYVLDHHRFTPPKTENLPLNVYNANPTLFGLHGLKEIVGAALNYLFVKAVDQSMVQHAWIALIGISGDTLNHVDEFQSYNRMVFEEALLLEQIEVKSGLCLYGAQFDRIDRALAHSILPFIPQFKGSRINAKEFLQSLNIDPSQKVETLEENDILLIGNSLTHSKVSGDYIVLPKKNGILRFPFEHAQLISILGSESVSSAKNTVMQRTITADSKQKYGTYLDSLVENLTTFVLMQKIVTQNAIFVDLTNKVPQEMWSDTGSFSSINQLYDSAKMLFIGGMTSETEYKLSVRCSPEFMNLHNQKGAVHAIRDFTSKFGGSGGGHGLAGGIRLSIQLYTELTRQIDDIIDHF